MVGKVIAYLLKENTGLMALVSEDKIFPYVINEKTHLPAIVYTIDSVDPEYTKEGWSGDDVTFSIVSFTNNYANLQSIVSQIRSALELKSGTYSGIEYWNILLDGQSEGFSISENVFLNRLTFSTTITDY